MRSGNLHHDLPSSSAEESFSELACAGPVRIERIVSHGQVSPANFWYDQTETEYVLLVSGAAELEFAGGEKRSLAPGDWLEIPAHVRHRVSFTDPSCPTVWLAVFYPERGTP